MDRVAVRVAVAMSMALTGCAGRHEPPPPDRPTTASISVTLYHCGVDPITYRGEKWEASPEPFDNTNKPSTWRGHGTITEVGPQRLLYRDDSGIELTFLPDAEVPPRNVCA